MPTDTRRPAVPVLAETGAWLAVDKPAGWETVVTGGGDASRCLAGRLRRAHGLPGLAPVHRLDRDTTGCLLCAKTDAARATLEAAFRERTVEKEYLALVLGAPRNPEGTIRRRLSEWEGGRRPVRVVKGGGRQRRGPKGYEAETGYRLLVRSPAAARVVGGDVPEAGDAALPGPLAQTGCSLVHFAPKTGRTHQIRVHAADFGRPVLGDDQYGDRDANRAAKDACGLARQALHAWRIRFDDPQDGGPVFLTAPVPPDMAAALDAFLPGWRDGLP